MIDEFKKKKGIIFDDKIDEMVLIVRNDKSHIYHIEDIPIISLTYQNIIRLMATNLGNGWYSYPYFAHFFVKIILEILYCYE